MEHLMRLAVGSHKAGTGAGCAMNVISWENGDTTITDFPSCTDEFLARVVQRLNDTYCTHLTITATDSLFDQKKMRVVKTLCPRCSVEVLAIAHRTVGTSLLDTHTHAERAAIYAKVANKCAAYADAAYAAAANAATDAAYAATDAANAANANAANAYAATDAANAATDAAAAAYAAAAYAAADAANAANAAARADAAYAATDAANAATDAANAAYAATDAANAATAAAYAAADAADAAADAANANATAANANATATANYVIDEFLRLAGVVPTVILPETIEEAYAKMTSVDYVANS